MRATDGETRPVVGLKKGSKEEKAARAELLARTLAANACEEPVGEVVVGAELDHFDIRIERDTIAFTETARFFVQAKDAQNQDIKIDSSQKVFFYLMVNPGYGTFIDAKGDTVKSSPPSLPDVRYGDAHQGKIRFAAVRKNPETQATSTIRAEWQKDPTKMGEKQITVLEQTLKIVMIGPREVRPSIPTEDNDTNMVRLRRNPFEVRMTRAGKPVPNHAFRLRTDYVRESGGHDHTNTHTTVRADNNDNYGFFLSGQPEGRHRPLDDETNASGRFSASYHGSIFGDTMKIYLESRINQLLRDSISVVEKVADLELLPESDNYTPIGGRQEHHGPPLHPRREDNHNHFATAAVNQNIDAIAAEYHRQFRTLSRLDINDMSLPFGGKFDIFGRWVGDHDYHRNGLDVDVRSGTMPGDRFEDTDRDDEYDLGEPLVVDNNGNRLYDNDVMPAFQEIALDNGVYSARLEFPGGRGGAEHWHLYFWNVRRR